MSNEENFFERNGLSVSASGIDTMEVGQSYPLYGMITRFIKEVPGETIIEVNNSLLLNITIEDPVKLEVLKRRAFEPGIFISELLHKGDPVLDEAPVFDCKTIVFGRPSNQEV